MRNRHCCVSISPYLRPVARHDGTRVDRKTYPRIASIDAMVALLFFGFAILALLFKPRIRLEA